MTARRCHHTDEARLSSIRNSLVELHRPWYCKMLSMFPGWKQICCHGGSCAKRDFFWMHQSRICMLGKEEKMERLFFGRSWRIGNLLSSKWKTWRVSLVTKNGIKPSDTHRRRTLIPNATATDTSSLNPLRTSNALPAS